jgi:hypothetical protein
MQLFPILRLYGDATVQLLLTLLLYGDATERLLWLHGDATIQCDYYQHCGCMMMLHCDCS